MTMHPDALDRMIPRSPWEATRDRYAELANDDRPGDPNAFDPREEEQGSPFFMWMAVVAVVLIGLSFVAAIR